MAAGLNKALSLGCSTTNLSSVIKALMAADEKDPLVAPLEAWRFAEIARDAAKARVRVAHYTYVKRPAPEGDGWALEPFGDVWSGDRELRDYCGAVIDHLQSLRPVMEEIRDELARR